MRHIFIVVVLFLLYSCGGTDNTKIESLTKTNKGFKVVVKDYYADGNTNAEPSWSSEYKYNETGLLEKLTTTSFGKYEWTITESFSYDDHGNIIKYTKSLSSANRNTSSESELKYDDNDLLIQVGEVKVTNTTNSNGQVVKQQIGGHRIYNYDYDRNSRITKVTINQDANEVAGNTISYEYHPNGNLKSRKGGLDYEREMYQAPSLPTKTAGRTSLVVDYDNNGDEERLQTKAGNGITHVIFEYEYDDRGNWIKKTVKNNKSGNISSVTERTITYFE